MASRATRRNARSAISIARCKRLVRWRLRRLRDRAGADQRRARSSTTTEMEERGMGKYFIAWLLGVPAGLLILIYVFTHLF